MFSRFFTFSEQKNTVNTDVFGSAPTQNHGIYEVLSLCEQNHSIYRVLWPGPSKNTGIYAVSCMLSEAFFGCQRHKNIVNYTIFTRGQYQKIMKN